VPKTLPPMITGRAPAHEEDANVHAPAYGRSA